MSWVTNASCSDLFYERRTHRDKITLIEFDAMISGMRRLERDYMARSLC